MSESLHKAIFQSTLNLDGNSLLNQLKDYYKTNLQLTDSESKELALELSQVKDIIHVNHQSEIESIIKALSNPMLLRSHVAGD